MNPFALFKELIASPRLQVGTVLSVNDGTAEVELPGGGVINARGSATVGTSVFVRNGVIEGQAPNLPAFDITV